MNARTVILLALVALLLVGSAAWAQPGGLLSGYVVKPGTASGGGYRLSGVTWQARGIASGGGYRLAVPVGPAGTGTPCCCTYLPCVLRNH
ncbi:MAG: hypothetical protein H5T61_13010 [Thermoflexales bacterium]|nr:hypothetical protein [Thermoflexales bacterium]